MAVSRRAWLTESARAVAVAATGFAGLQGGRAAFASAGKSAPVKLPAEPLKGPTVVGDVIFVPEGALVRAFSRRCPHLGCSVGVDADGSGLACPCHGSRFTLGGERISGPAASGLVELVVEGE